MVGTLRGVAAAVLVAAAAACQDATAPATPTLDDLVGTYMASEAVYTSAADQALRRDIIAVGGAYILQIHPGGQYTTTLERPGSTHLVRQGTLEPSGNRLVVTERNAAPRMVDFTLDGDVLTWNDAADRYDFGEGAAPARFRATMTR
jgi:hypothetical protein